MRWPGVTFRTLYAEPSRNGVYKSKEYHGAGVRIVNMGELFAYDVITDQEMNRLNMTEEEMRKSGLVNGDLLFGRRSLVEAGAGKCSLVESLTEPTTFESSIIRVRLDQTKSDPRFYFYWFKSHHGKAAIHAIVTGTNVKGITGSNLGKIKVVNPPIKVQNDLVIKIRQYDDLIENNRRRIQLLEWAARLIYKEWFVHLRFPGHEHAKIRDGVPEGWERNKIQDIAETIGGGTPSTKIPEYWVNGDITWFIPKDLTNNDCLVLLDSEKKISSEGLKKSSAKLLPPETILMTSRASIGYFGLYDGVACTNQGFISIIPKSENLRMYILYNLINRKEEILSLAGGTTYKEINKTTFRNIDIIVPEQKLLDKFQCIANDTAKNIRALKKQIFLLKQARDILLPRLMNGEISV